MGYVLIDSEIVLKVGDHWSKISWVARGQSVIKSWAPECNLYRNTTQRVKTPLSIPGLLCTATMLAVPTTIRGTAVIARLFRYIGKSQWGFFLATGNFIPRQFKPVSLKNVGAVPKGLIVIA